jgi:BirA family transcriptional regulator, biotin operon repressor / biotin---[acetyl-CoA-carboxylase] ligase
VIRPEAMPLSSARRVRYDGHTADDLQARLRLPRVVLFDEVGSTLDVAHELGEQGTAAGSLVLANAQTAGRGRMGRSWRSEPGSGIWLTLVERPASDDALGVLALRLALLLAPALDPFASERVQLKWPNDLFVGDRKLAGILVEARWRGARLDWVAIGVGINVRPPAELDVGGLAPGSDRITVLGAVVPALRAAAAAGGPLTDEELQQFRARDRALGKRCAAPIPGEVAGVRRDGALLVVGANGVEAVHAGSLILEAEGG